jgi:hypothetical protein
MVGEFVTHQLPSFGDSRVTNAASGRPAATDPARMTVRAVDLFPQPDPPQLKLGKLLFDFSAQTVFFALSLTFLTAGEHPQLIASPSY